MSIMYWSDATNGMVIRNTVRKADLVKIELEQHLAEALADNDRDHEEIARLNEELAYLETHRSEY